MSLYEDIYNDFREAIKNGSYPPGTRLPAIREVAEQRGCNKLTVKKAFDLLKEKGLIDNQVGRGSFVAYPDMIAAERPHVYTFHSAYINEELFPVAEAEKIFEELFKEGQRLFGAGPIGGEPELISALAKRYDVAPENTLIISGAQQGLNLCSSLFNLNVSEHMVFEDPTYSGAISVFKPRHFVPLDQDGPKLEALREKIQQKVRFFYVMPEVHNPTGISYSREKIEKVAAYAEEFDFYIIEDDYLSEFLDYRPLRFLDLIPDRTIYIKSLSKVTAPGIRIGFMTVPRKLYQKFLQRKYSADIGTTSMMQKFLTRFIENGLMDRHVNRCKEILKTRRKSIFKILQGYPFLQLNPDQKGYNLWVESDIPLSLATQPWAAGENFSFSSRFQNAFRISLMGMNEQDFAHGTAYLDSLFSSYCQQSDRRVL